MGKKKNKQQEDKPLLKLIKNLVNVVDNKETTILTNSQLQTMLYKELDEDIWSAHPLELDVYMNILKTFIKQWPNWGILEKAVQDSQRDPKFNMDKIVNREYENFKKYLKQLLDLSKPDLKKNLAKLKKLEEQEESTTDVVLEVCCTRSQLNNLFFTQPNPELGDTIFNIKPSNPKVKQKVYKLEELLNWPNLCFHATFGAFEYVRTNKVDLKHTLINKKLRYANTEQPKLSNHVHSRVIDEELLGSSIERTHAIDFYKSLINELPKGIIHRLFISNLLQSIVNDLTVGPPNVDQGNEYMYFPSRHAYVRYLKADVNHSQPASELINYSKYLLYLEEIITPCVTFKLKHNMVEMTKKEIIKLISNLTEPWIIVECLDCETKFEGIHSMTDLKNHILNKHCPEPDIQCMECKKKFTLRLMAFNCWKHECISKK